MFPYEDLHVSLALALVLTAGSVALQRMTYGFDKSPPVFLEVFTDYMFLCCWPELMMFSFQTLALRNLE